MRKKAILPQTAESFVFNNAEEEITVTLTNEDSSADITEREKAEDQMDTSENLDINPPAVTSNRKQANILIPDQLYLEALPSIPTHQPLFVSNCAWLLGLNFFAAKSNYFCRLSIFHFRSTIQNLLI